MRRIAGRGGRRNRRPGRARCRRRAAGRRGFVCVAHPGRGRAVPGATAKARARVSSRSRGRVRPRLPARRDRRVRGRCLLRIHRCARRGGSARRRCLQRGHVGRSAGRAGRRSEGDDGERCHDDPCSGRREPDSPRSAPRSRPGRRRRRHDALRCRRPGVRLRAQPLRLRGPSLGLPPQRLHLRPQPRRRLRPLRLGDPCLRPQCRGRPFRIGSRRRASRGLLPRRPSLDHGLLMVRSVAQVAVRVDRSSRVRPGLAGAACECGRRDRGRRYSQRSHEPVRGRRFDKAKWRALEACRVDEVPAVRAARGTAAGAVTICPARRRDRVPVPPAAFAELGPEIHRPLRAGAVPRRMRHVSTIGPRQEGGAHRWYLIRAALVSFGAGRHRRTAGGGHSSRRAAEIQWSLAGLSP